MRALLGFAIKQWLLILAGTALLVGVGVWSAMRLPIDAVPDITNVQVQINTVSSALSPVEVERQITLPVELAMSGLPDLQQVRSLSKFGISQVTVVFQDDVNIYFARQLVQERLQQARENIPNGLGVPTMGPVSTGLGEIFLYTVESPELTGTELRTLQDWVIKPQLRTVPGVAEVNSWGGFEKQYQVLVQPNALAKYSLTLRQIFEAIAANNVSAGGGYILKSAEQYVLRGVGRLNTTEDIKLVVIASRDGIPIRVRDVADVQVGSAIRQGVVSKDGRGEVVIGIVMMLVGSNSRTVIEDVKERFGEVQRTLPKNVVLKVFYDRSELVNRTLRTVQKNLFEGALLVIAVLFLLLGNFRAAMIVALSIPLSMLFAVSLMLKVGIAGSLMSLGAIDFGLVVDGSVVMVENAVRRLAERRNDQRFLHTVFEATAEVARPVIFGVGIIIVVYLPILTLQGVEGKLFRPMAMTVVYALLGSLLLTFTLTPALIALLLRGTVPEGENRLIRKAKSLYSRILTRALNHKKPVLAVAALSFLTASALAPFLGSEFVPRLDEGGFAVNVLRLPSISIEESTRQSGLIERRLLHEFPDEISGVLIRTGRAEVATDPMGANFSDLFINLKPQSEWRKSHDKTDLERQLVRSLEMIPGLVFGFSQPIELRMNELIAGVRSDFAIKIYGDDFTVLKRKADEIVAVVSRLSGASEFKAQQISGLPTLDIIADPNRMSRYGVRAEDVMQVVEAFGGLPVTQVLEGQRRFDLVLRIPQEFQRDKEAIARVLVTGPGGQRVPLGAVATIREVEGPAEISHLNGSRLMLVEGNVRGSDIGTFVTAVRKLFDSGRLELPPGYRVEFGGQFENLERARTRLALVVPLSLSLIFLLLFTTFNSLRQALLVFTGVPLAAVGGVFSLLLRGMPFSISAGVGFIALFGVAVLNGLVMVSYINTLRKEGNPLLDSVREGAMTRLRPVLMTALVASLGFIPMAISTGSGAEVQRPLATVVIGGLVSSTLLTLLVLPILYSIFESRQDGVAQVEI